MDGRLSVSLLFYGDFPHLAHRCLESIWSRLRAGREQIQDLRLGLNEISPATRRVVDWFVHNASRHYGIPVITYDCPVNACKYPLIRHILLDDPLPPAEWVMWFDDDSYLTGGDDWWNQLLQAANSADMLGKVYTQGVVGRQWEWISQQPWFNPEVGRPPRDRKKRIAFRFATGGWWSIRSRILKDHDWPTRELRHRGGDALLGELCRHRGYRLVNFEAGVRINADEQGRHSKATRRGVNELQLGHLATGSSPDHNFVCTRTVY